MLLQQQQQAGTSDGVVDTLWQGRFRCQQLEGVHSSHDHAHDVAVFVDEWSARVSRLNRGTDLERPGIIANPHQPADVTGSLNRLQALCVGVGMAKGEDLTALAKTTAGNHRERLEAAGDLHQRQVVDRVPVDNPRRQDARAGQHSHTREIIDTVRIGHEVTVIGDKEPGARHHRFTEATRRGRCGTLPKGNLCHQLAAQPHRLGELTGGHRFPDSQPVVSGTLVALFRSEIQPGEGGHAVFDHSQALAIRCPEIVLGIRVPLLGSLPVPPGGFSIVLGDPGTEVIGPSEVVLGIRVATVGGFPIPPCRLPEVFDNSLALVIRDGQVELGRNNPLRRGFAVPLDRFPVIFGNTFTEVVGPSETDLGIRMALFCGLATPPDRFRFIFFNALTKTIRLGKMKLGAGQPLVGGFAVPLDRFSVVFRHTVTKPIRLSEVKLGLRDPLVGGLSVPLDRFRVVLRDPDSDGAGLSQGELRPGVPLLRFLAKCGHPLAFRFIRRLAGQRNQENT